MTRSRTFLRGAGTGLFGFGFLMVGLIGTAPDVPFHTVGLPFCAMGALLLMFDALLAKRSLPSGWLLWVILPALAYFSLRAATSPVLYLGEMDLFLIASFVCAGAAVAFAGHGRWLIPWAVMLAAGGLLISAWQIFLDQDFTPLAFLDLRKPVVESTANGFFFNRNPYGTWCAMLLLWFTALLLWGRNRKGLTLLLLLGAVTAGIGLLASFCRAALFGASLGAAVLIAGAFIVLAHGRGGLWKKSAGMAGIFAAVGSLGAFAAWWLPQLVAHRFAKHDFAIDYLGARTGYWKTALNQFLEHTALGGGARSYAFLSYRFWDTSLQKGAADPQYAHNEYAQTLADYGLLGLLLLLVALVAVLLIAPSLAGRIGRHDVTRKGRWEVAWSLGAGAALVALLGDCFFSFSGHFAPQALLAGALVGGLVAAGRGGRPAKPPSQWGWANITLLALLLVGSSAFLLHPGVSYARATLLRYQSDAAYNKNSELTPEAYVEEAREAARILPRYPHFFRSSFFCLWAANNEEDEALSTPLMEEALVWADRAVEAHPQSAEARLHRAHLRNALGHYPEADEDYSIATELTRLREFYFRTWMRIGETHYERALEQWQARDMNRTCSLLRSSLKAYEESNKRIWAHGVPRWKNGRKKVLETIAFLKRTGEWVE